MEVNIEGEKRVLGGSIEERKTKEKGRKKAEIC
jgi:hypothetical protein